MSVITLIILFSLPVGFLVGIQMGRAFLASDGTASLKECFGFAVRVIFENPEYLMIMLCIVGLTLLACCMTA